MTCARTSTRAPRRRGSVYLLVLAVSMIVAVIGLSAMVVVRLDLRSSGRSADARRAEILALSAVEQALTIIRDVPTWRSDYVHDDPAPAEIPMGDGFVSIRIVDESGDGDLGAGDDDPVRVFGIGRVDEAVRVHSVRLQSGQSVPALMRPVHAAVAVEINKPLTVSGGPLSTNGTLHMNSGPLTGDAEAGAVTGVGTITGTLTVPAEPKPMPPASIFGFYHAQSTEIPFVANDGGPEISNVVLGATSNPWGGINPNGVYHIAVPDGATLWIDAFRLDGTLLITAGAGAWIIIDGDTHLEPYRDDYPVLMTRGGSYALDFDGARSLLSIDPVYATGVTGLVHVIGPSSVTDINKDLSLSGALISEGRVRREDGAGDATVTLDPDLASDPPLGYAIGSNALRVVAGSWRWESSE